MGEDVMSRGQSLYVLVWPGSPPSEHYLRAEDAKCTEPGCVRPGVIMDSEYDEPWCQQHADQFPADERPDGPEIVRLDSERYREVSA
jgi:hypothetical protein